VSEKFRSIVVCDFEYEVADGELPVPLCMVGCMLDENLRHMHAVRKWRGEFESTPPFDIGPDTLFVAYSAWAEMTCFIKNSVLTTAPVTSPGVRKNLSENRRFEH
jgi:hypothetical protein